MRINSIVRVAFALLLSMNVSSATRAQVLADKVPADSFVYIGCKGTATPNSGYTGSHFQAVFEASKLRELGEQTLPQVIEMVGKEEPEAGEALRVAHSIVVPLMKHPSALFVRPAAADAKDESPVRAGVICQAGAESKALAQKIREAIDKAPKAKPYLRVIESADTVSVLVGYSEADAQAAPTATLVTAAPFAGAIKQAWPASPNAAPFIAVYLDMQRGMELFDQAMTQEGAEAVRMWHGIRDTLGLGGLHRFYFAGDFIGKDWASTAFVEAPAPRKGLVKLFEGRAIEPEVLKQIPASAGGAQVVRFDLAGFVNLVRETFGAVSAENGTAMFDQGLGVAQMSLGVNPMSDIVEPLSDTWVLFSDESLAGNGTPGLVIQNKLKDAEKANRGFGALWRFATNSLGQQQRDRMGIKLVEQTQEGVHLWTVQATKFQVGWTIHNGNLIVGLHDDGVVKAALRSAGKGLDQNEKFAALIKQASAGNTIASFRFMDLPQSAPPMHDELKAKWAEAVQEIAEQGATLPPDILPPLEVVKVHMATSMEVGWTNDAGFHWRSTLPFPAADAYSNQPNIGMAQSGAVGAVAFGAAIALPSLNRARETANRVKCASNQRQIGQAILLYSNDNKGQYPPDLGSLILTQDISVYEFICPSSSTSPPDDLVGMSPQQQADWVNKNSNFIYVGKGLTNDAPAEKIILIEKLDDHDADGMNCLFGDGHVEFLIPSDPRWPEVNELLKQGK